MNPNRKKPLVGCSCGSYSSVGNMKEPLRNNVKVEELDMRQTELQIQSKQQNTTSKHNLTNHLVSHSSVGADSLVFFALDVCKSPADSLIQSGFLMERFLTSGSDSVLRH